MSKERIKGIVTGFIVSLILLICVMVVASTQTITREITFGVNVMFDGKIVQFDYDSRPFIMGGRTFLPLRAMAELLNLPISFDSITNTAIIGTELVIAKEELRGTWVRYISAELAQPREDGRRLLCVYRPASIDFLPENRFVIADYVSTNMNDSVMVQPWDGVGRSGANSVIVEDGVRRMKWNGTYSMTNTTLELIFERNPAYNNVTTLAFTILEGELWLDSVRFIRR